MFTRQSIRPVREIRTGGARERVRIDEDPGGGKLRASQSDRPGVKDAFRKGVIQRRKKEPKTLAEIQRDFLDQYEAEKDRLVGEIRRAEAELDVLLERAGIKLGPDDRVAAGADDWRVEVYYGRQARERVFSVPDVELRKQIMYGVDHLRHAWWGHAEGLSTFGDSFVDRLRHERCDPPRPLNSVMGGLAFVGAIVLWLGHRSLATFLVIAFGLLVLLGMFAIEQFVALHQHDVTMQEGIAYVERRTAVWKREEERLLNRPYIFSQREKRTGEPDSLSLRIRAPVQT